MAPTEPLEVLRVLVNFCADNDANRLSLVSGDVGVGEFWSWLFTQLHQASDSDVCTRAILLLGQFIHNIDEAAMATAVGALVAKGAVDAVLAYINQTHDATVMELLAEFSSVKPTAVLTQQLEWIVAAAGEIDAEDDDAGEALDHASRAIFNATNVDDRSGVAVVPALYRLIGAIPRDTANAVHIKRRLFAACGNISSYPSHDNWAEVRRHERLVVAPDSDLYVVAAAAISLGNCVSSNASQQQLLDQLESVERVVGAVMDAPLGDVVQYQAYHLLTNILAESSVGAVLGHGHLLSRATKVVVDNCAYYREIGAVYFKFLRKLIAVGDGPRVLGLTAVWDALAGCDDAVCHETKLVLLQVACGHKQAMLSVLMARLMSHSVAVQGSVEATYVLQQIKTVAVVLHHYSAEEIGRIYEGEEGESEGQNERESERESVRESERESERENRETTDTATTETTVDADSGKPHDTMPVKAIEHFVLPLTAFLHQLRAALGATGPGADAVANNTRFLAASALHFAAHRTHGPWAALAAACHAILG